MANITDVKLPDNSQYDLKDNVSGYQTETLATPITVDRTSETTVEGALGAVNDYADKIEGSMSNENLLDNPFFTVNERGNTSFSSAGYTVDRWAKEASGGGTLTLTSDGIQFPASQSGGNLYQLFESGKFLNKKITVTLKYSDGSFAVGTLTYTTPATTVINDGKMKVYLYDDTILLQHNTTDATARTIRAVKLELGSISTLANDIAPDYALELAKCQTSTADPSDTYANKGDIAVTSELSNRNLLDNGWFTVNQRGATSGTMAGNRYYYDRWIFTYSTTPGSFVETSNGIQLTPAANDSVQWWQYFENPTAINGKTVTISVLFGDGSIKQGSFVRISGTNQDITLDSNTQLHVSINATERISFYNKTEVTLRAVKLELGAVSTLANDVEPNYTTELLKCQRYFKVALNDTWNVGICIAMATDTIEFYYFSDIPMRVAPSISTVGSITAVKIADGSEVAISSVEGSFDINAKNGRINFKTSTTLTIRDLYILRMNNAKVMLSADL